MMPGGFSALVNAVLPRPLVRAGRRAARTLRRALGRGEPADPALADLAGEGDWRAAGEAAALWARAVCGVAPDARMLDIGCGPGRAAEGLLAWMDGAGAYTGFDVSKPAIAAAQARLSGHANARFIHADIHNGEYNPKGAIAAADYRFPAEDASFDYAFALSVFTHMRSADTAHYLREAARVLAPGGVFMATLFVLDRESRKAMALDRAAYRFDTPVDAVSETIDRRTPERAIAFDEGFVEQALAGAGLAPAAFHPGTWRGRAHAMAFQDMIVARKG